MITREHFAVVFLHEDNGTVSAYLPDLPGVYASADTMAGTRRGIRQALEGYLDAMRTRGWKVTARRADVAVARVETLASGSRVSLMGTGALLGRRTSPAKAAASRANGARGDRPEDPPPDGCCPPLAYLRAAYPVIVPIQAMKSSASSSAPWPASQYNRAFTSLFRFSRLAARFPITVSDV